MLGDCGTQVGAEPVRIVGHLQFENVAQQRPGGVIGRCRFIPVTMHRVFGKGGAEAGNGFADDATLAHAGRGEDLDNPPLKVKNLYGKRGLLDEVAELLFALLERLLCLFTMEMFLTMAVTLTTLSSILKRETLISAGKSSPLLFLRVCSM